MRRRLSLRSRLAALTAFAAIIVVTVASLALYRDLSAEISDAITTELEVRVGSLTDTDEFAAAIGEQHPIVAQVVDRAGRVIAPAGAPPVMTPAEVEAVGPPLVVDRAVPAIGRHARLLARPIDDDAIGVAATSTSALERARNRLFVILAIASPALTAAVTLAAWVLAGAALRPVRRMADRAETISLTAPGERLPVPSGRDEITHLGRTLNQMLGRIEATVAHERAFIDDASHELRTPLAVLRGELELALDDAAGVPEVADGLRSALDETDRLARLTEHLLTLARADAGELQSLAVRTDVTAAARDLVGRLGRDARIPVTVVGPPADLLADPQWVDQVLTNLLDNAERYARHTIEVRVAHDDRQVSLSVADDGDGFPVDLLGTVFDRFTRGDSVRGRGGAGLGMAIVASYVDALGGTVTAANGPPLGGAVVEISLPLAPRVAVEQDR